MLSLYDTSARTKRPFVPADPKAVTLYVCGPTVHGRAHIGNARSAVVFDVLFRLLRHLYGADHVVYARNITDIDDKIMAAAAAAGLEPSAIARRFEAHYHEDMASLGCLPPSHSPRATEHVGDMQRMIAALVDRGVAYVAEGHVLFEVARFPSYGGLGRRAADEMLAGARVEIAPWKRAPADFVLWKPSADDQPGWDSPWGRGRPGWHIECSAMIASVLGRPTIDLHGGGLDLVFPHHENEIAQSCCAHDGAPLARYWLHNGFVEMGEAKMSKSLGNIVTPADLLEAGWTGAEIRLALLSAHWRQPLVWTDELLAGARARLRRLIARDDGQDLPPAASEALFDDMNVPGALAAVAEGEGAGALLRLLGFSDFAERRAPPQVEALAAERARARAARDWAAADRAREEALALGWRLEDGRDGRTLWRPA